MVPVPADDFGEDSVVGCIELAAKFVQRFWIPASGDLKSTPVPLSWDNRATVAAQLAVSGEDLSSEVAVGSASEWLESVKREVLEEFAARTSGVLTNEYQRHSLVSFVRRIGCGGLSHPEMGDTRLAILLSSSNLAAMVQARVQNSNTLFDCRVAAAETFRQLVARPERLRESVFAFIAAWLTMRALGCVLLRDDASRQETIVERLVLSCDPLEKAYLCELGLLSPLLTELSPTVRQLVPRQTSWRGGMWEGIAEEMTSLSQFSRRMIGCDNVLPVLGSPCLVSSSANKFLPTWLNRSSASSQHGVIFESKLAGLLRGVEEKLRDLSASPRPAIMMETFKWTRQQCLPSPPNEPGAPIPAADIRHVLIAVRDVLVFLHARDAVPLLDCAADIPAPPPADTLLQSLQDGSARLASLPAHDSVVQATWLLLEALRSRLTDEADARWSDLLDGQPEIVRQIVLAIIGHCPPVYLLEADLKLPLESTELSERLRQFLDFAMHQPLRRIIAERLVKRCLASDTDLASITSAFRKCLQCGDSGGKLFVAETLCRLFEALFRPISNRQAAETRPAAGDQEESSFEEILRWIRPGRRRKWLLKHLIQIVEFRSWFLTAQETTNRDRLHRLWRTISMLGTDGLGPHRLPPRELGELRGFWFRFCRLAIRRFGTYPPLLDTGLLQIDTPEVFASTLFADLVRQELQDQASASPVPVVSLKFDELPQWLRRFLARPGALQTRLVIQGLLIIAGDAPRYRLNLKKLFPEHNSWLRIPHIAYATADRHSAQPHGVEHADSPV